MSPVARVFHVIRHVTLSQPRGASFLPLGEWLARICVVDLPRNHVGLDSPDQLLLTLQCRMNAVAIEQRFLRGERLKVPVLDSSPECRVLVGNARGRSFVQRQRLTVRRPQWLNLNQEREQ